MRFAGLSTRGWYKLPQKARKPRKTQIYLKIFEIMVKRNYINPLVVRSTMAVLEDFRTTHPESKTPMADTFRYFNEPESERQRYVRAAKRLNWNIVKTRGHVYENGFFIW